MIYHELWSKHLRMGNWLFKYAASTALSYKHNVPSVYNDYFLWDYLENSPWIIEQNPECERIYPTQWEWTKEEQERLDNLDYTKNIEFSLNFFFQSYKWFEGYEKEVFNRLKIKQEQTDRVKDKYQYIFDRNQPTIGISIRLGDFIGHGDFYQIPYHWYLKALHNNFPHWKERPVIVFSDDINKAKQIFQGLGFFYADPNGTHTHADNFKHYHSEKAMDQFILANLVDDWIIGNSTFSWFLAWLSWMKSPLNRVIHCGQVFSRTGNMKHCNTEHYYHPSWIKEEL